MSLSKKQYYQLKNGQTNSGKIGARVEADTGDVDNHAWIVVQMKNRNITAVSPIFQVEYVELSKAYDEEVHGWDADLFLIKREIFYNLQTEKELTQLLTRWLDDLASLTPLHNIHFPF